MNEWINDEWMNDEWMNEGMNEGIYLLIETNYKE